MWSQNPRQKFTCRCVVQFHLNLLFGLRQLSHLETLSMRMNPIPRIAFFEMVARGMQSMFPQQIQP